MSRSGDRPSPFLLFTPPYRGFVPLSAPVHFLREGDGLKGSALIWSLASGRPTRDVEIVSRRPAGVALIVVLPPASALRSELDLLGIIGRCRPTAIVPFHEDPDPEDMSALLRRPPSELAIEFTDYLAWRGVSVDRETRRILRRTIELSDELRTITGLSRAVYLSRRALGRRLVTRGLPVPSHWLQFGRILRAALRLQNSDDSLYAVACSLGYPDGFALSNQMKRLTDVRPSIARECLGWEWLVESWLRKERSTGGLTMALRESDLAGLPADPPSSKTKPTWKPRRRSSVIQLPAG